MLSGAAGHWTGQSHVECLTSTTRRAYLPDALSTRMRKRRCFADTELEAVTLEHERAHALLATRQSNPVPRPPPAQQRVLFPLPAGVTAPYRLPPPELACSETAAMRLIGLVRSWRTLHLGADIRTTSRRECWPATVGLTSKSSVVDDNGGVDVGETFSDVVIGGQPLSPYITGLHSTLAGPAAIFRTTTTTVATRDTQRSGLAVANQCQDFASTTWTGRSAGDDCRSQLRDSDIEEHRRLDSKPLRRTHFDFSVESLLTK